METKKNESADLTRKSSYFFSIGLLIATSLMVMAFEWRQYDKGIIDLVGKNQNPTEELIDIPPTSDVPPPAPIVKNLVLIEVEKDIKEDSIFQIDIETTEATKLPEFILPLPEPEEASDEPVIFAEEPASPRGGFEGFYKYVGEKMKYPAQARRMGIEGRVFVEFIINKDGSLTEIKFIKGIGAGCDEEAVRVIQSAPAWNPAKQRGKAVKQRYTLPIIFKLG